MNCHDTHDTTGTSIRIRRSLGAMLAAAVLTAGALAGTAAWAAAEHSHGHDAHALELNAGKKWATDDPLRQGMTKIRDAVDAKLPAVHRGKMSTAQYAALGGEIDAQIAHIVQNCKLDPKADEVLHAQIGRRWYVPRYASLNEALAYGDECWSRVLSHWRDYKEQGLTEHRNWWPEVYRQACAGWGVDPDPEALAFCETYEETRADLKDISMSG